MLVRCGTFLKIVDRKDFLSECNRKKIPHVFSTIWLKYRNGYCKIIGQKPCFSGVFIRILTQIWAKIPRYFKTALEHLSCAWSQRIFCHWRILLWLHFIGTYTYTKSCTRQQKWRRTLYFRKKTFIFAVFFWKTHTISHGIPRTAYRSNIPHQHCWLGSCEFNRVFMCGRCYLVNVFDMQWCTSALQWKDKHLYDIE